MHEPRDISVNTIKNKLRQKLADEIAFFEGNAVAPLDKFLQIIRCKYMIDNVVNIIEGLKNKVDAASLEANADPLGLFPEMKTIKVEAEDFGSLYATVLIDTAIGPYFIKFIDDSVKELKTSQDIQNFFKETKPEILRTSLKKIWLEEFIAFSETLNSTSRVCLLNILNVEADFRTIQVVYNSLTESQRSNRVMLRKSVVSPFGTLYPDFMRQLIDADTLEVIRSVLSVSPAYRKLVQHAPDPQKMDEFNVNSKSFEDFLFEEECKLYSRVWDTQCNFAVFYSYIKLKEQEIRNLVWIGEMITRKLSKGHQAWNKIIIPFFNMK